MTTALAPFDFAGATLRGGEYDGEPVLVAKDVCDALGIAKYRDALAQLDDDERVSIAVDTPGGRQQMTAVTEGGIWSLAFISRSPKVKAFRRWVTHTVLPAIRKTGSYSVAPANLPTEIDAAMLRQIAAAMEAKDAKIAELEPKAEVADRFLTASTSSRLIGQVAKELDLTEKNLRQFMRDEGLIFTRQLPCGHSAYDFYARHAAHFEATETPVEHGAGRVATHYTVRVTPRGVELITKRLATYRKALVAGVSA